MTYNKRVLVDASYRTMLGTGFYDRRSELEKLSELLQGVRTVIVYGPRNAGKSELVRYFITKRLGLGSLARLSHRVVLIDARRRRMEKYLGPGRDAPGFLDELLSSVTGLPRGLVGFLEGLVSRVRPPILVFIDEFHLLFGASLGEALAELEAVAGFLAKRAEKQLRLVVTVSEGFFATTSALSRLSGYSTGYLLVEPMDTTSFEALYNEYEARHGCSIGLSLFIRLAGTSPGYLADLCPRSRKLLEDWVLTELQRLGMVLDLAAEAIGMTRDEAMEAASRLLRGEPPRTPRELRLGEKLVEANVAYPCLRGPRQRYLPQLPLYLAALENRFRSDILEWIREYEIPTPSRCMDSSY